LATSPKFKFFRREQKKDKPKETTMEFIGSMAALLVTGLFIVTFNFQAFEIPSRSMENTLLIGDHLFVDRTTAAPPTQPLKHVVPYLDIKRGDIIVFISPIQPGLHVVKRIIGVPGDRIRLKGGVLYRNGERVNEPYTFPLKDYNPYRDDFPSVSPEFAGNVSPEWAVSLPSHIENGELVVPPGGYFGMGDHRDLSLDSRYWGFIPRENIIGRPMFIYWSFDTPEDQYLRSTPGERISWLLHVVVNFFNKTRWSRTLNLIH
jgi:signal peptidase I